MATSVKPVPDGYHSITPYLIVNDALRFIDFLKQALGASERMRAGGKDHLHAELEIGDSLIMVGDARDSQAGPIPAALYLYVEDVDAVYERALAAGATSVAQPADQFYGDRSAWIKDQFGNTWFIASRKENLGAEEIQRRAAKAHPN